VVSIQWTHCSDEYIVGVTVLQLSNPGVLNFCGVEQWSARLAHNQEVVGSNPTSRNQLLGDKKAIAKD